MTTQEDYPPNIVEASRLLAAIVVLIHYPYTINIDKLEIVSTTFSDIEDHKEKVEIIYRIEK